MTAEPSPAAGLSLGDVPPSAAPRPATRFDDIDRLKTMAIALVVFGHVVARQPPTGAEWFWYIKDALYQFHMCVFMFVSGFLFFKPGQTFVGSAYTGMVRSRAVRLLLPFIIMGLIVILIKFTLPAIVHVDRPVERLGPALLDIGGLVSESPATFIWYLFALFVYSVAAPLLLRVTRGLMGLLVLALVLMAFGNMPSGPTAQYMLKFFPFFVLGGIGRIHQQAYYAFLRRAGFWLVVPFVVALVVYTTLLAGRPIATYKIQGLLTVGLTAIPFFHMLARSSAFAKNRVLLAWSRYVLAIYLFNVPLIGAAKAVLLKIMPWDAGHFALLFPTLFLVGFVGSTLLKRFVLSRVPVLDRLTS